MNEYLISQSKVTNKNKIISTDEISTMYNSYNDVIVIAMTEGNLYKMANAVYHNDSKLCTNVTANKQEIT